jgi:hypothetical protein
MAMHVTTQNAQGSFAHLAHCWWGETFILHDADFSMAVAVLEREEQRDRNRRLELKSLRKVSIRQLLRYH